MCVVQLAQYTNKTCRYTRKLHCKNRYSCTIHVYLLPRCRPCLVTVHYNCSLWKPRLTLSSKTDHAQPAGGKSQAGGNSGTSVVLVRSLYVRWNDCCKYSHWFYDYNSVCCTSCICRTTFESLSEHKAVYCSPACFEKINSCETLFFIIKTEHFVL